MMDSLGQVGRYELQKELGRGGMAVVYLASDPNFEREVALKVLPHALLHDPSFRLRFQREAKAIASLEHGAIVPVYDYGEHEGMPYLVMRYMAGGSLYERLSQGMLSFPEVEYIIARLARGLDKAHQSGIVHRDLKPANILFDHDGDAYLSDFGIVKLVESTATLTGTGIIGTPAYMSPEQAKGISEVDGRSDIYALGAILFEMLTGELPFQADTPLGLAIKHITEPVPRILEKNPSLPPACEDIIHKAMAKSPDDRYDTALLLLSDLTAVINSSSPSAPVVSRTSSPQLTSSKPHSQGEKGDTQTLQAGDGAESRSSVLEQTAASYPYPERKRKVPWWAWPIVLAVVGFAIWGAFNMINGNGETPALTPLPTQPPTEVVAVVAEPTATPEPAATAEPTETTAPTATATLTPLPTETPTATQTATVLATTIPIVQVVPNSINVRSGPGVNYNVVGFLTSEQTVRVVARTANDNWYLVELEDGSKGWVSTAVVNAVEEFDLNGIEIAATVPALPPTATPMPTSTSTPAPSSSGGGGGDNNSPEPTFTRPSP